MAEAAKTATSAADDDVPISASSVSFASNALHAAVDSAVSCLLPLLQPVRHCPHPFLQEQDVLRALRACRSIASYLLSDYAITQHVFNFRYGHSTVAEAKASLAFYERYCNKLRILRLALPRHWNEPLVDADTGRPLLPPSLLALSMGAEVSYQEQPAIARRSLEHYTHPAAMNELQVSGSRSGSGSADDSGNGSEAGEDDFERRIRPVNVEKYNDTAWNVFEYGWCDGAFNQPIPPGALPHGLRCLEFNHAFNQPLEAGSIPATLHELQFGRRFNQPLQPHVLPPSLVQLNFGGDYNQPLLPGSLPAGLQQLHLGGASDHTLQAGLLPPQLKGLFLGWTYNQPILPRAIPPSVTHLRFSDQFNQLLQPGRIPHGVVHLSFGDGRFDQPLVPGVLPPSLRELLLSREFNQPLLPDSLPDGLKVLSFPRWAHFAQPLQPGVIPASVWVLSLHDGYQQDLVAGGVPATVKWLRLPFEYASKDLSALSPSTRLVWWER